MASEREIFVYKAQLSFYCDRYDEMVINMKRVAIQYKELTVRERKLFVTGFKGEIMTRRKSWKNLSKKIDETAAEDPNVGLMRLYKQRMEDEMTEICNDMLSLLDQYLIPHSSIYTQYETVLYHTMKGDCNVYLSEIKLGAERQAAIDAALLAYETAQTKARIQLAGTGVSPAHPLRLNLELNLAVFYHEVLEDDTKACEIADKAIDEAGLVLRDLNEEDYKESTGLIKTLLSNLNNWSLPPNVDEDPPFFNFGF